MGYFARNVVGDTVVAALLATTYAAAVAVAVHVDGPLGDGFLTGYVTVGGWLIWIPLWSAVLRRRGAPGWWAAPLVTSVGPYLLYSELETGRSYVSVLAAFAVTVTVLAGTWSWLGRGVSGR